MKIIELTGVFHLDIHADIFLTINYLYIGITYLVGWIIYGADIKFFERLVFDWRILS